MEHASPTGNCCDSRVVWHTLVDVSDAAEKVTCRTLPAVGAEDSGEVLVLSDAYCDGGRSGGPAERARHDCIGNARAVGAPGSGGKRGTKPMGRRAVSLGEYLGGSARRSCHGDCCACQ